MSTKLLGLDSENLISIKFKVGTCEGLWANKNGFLTFFSGKGFDYIGEDLANILLTNYWREKREKTFVQTIPS